MREEVLAAFGEGAHLLPPDPLYGRGCNRLLKEGEGRWAFEGFAKASRDPVAQARAHRGLWGWPLRQGRKGAAIRLSHPQGAKEVEGLA